MFNLNCSTENYGNMLMVNLIYGSNIKTKRIQYNDHNKRWDFIT